jgi:hypothetical protein
MPWDIQKNNYPSNTFFNLILDAPRTVLKFLVADRIRDPVPFDPEFGTEKFWSGTNNPDPATLISFSSEAVLEFLNYLRGLGELVRNRVIIPSHQATYCRPADLIPWYRLLGSLKVGAQETKEKPGRYLTENLQHGSNLLSAPRHGIHNGDQVKGGPVREAGLQLHHAVLITPAIVLYDQVGETHSCSVSILKHPLVIY